MSYDDNPYYAPEKFGLEIVAEANVNPCYDFTMFVVWKDSTGKLYWAADSGCSCPAPYEDYQSLDDLATGSIQDCHDAVDSWGDEISYHGGYLNDIAELHSALAKLG